MGLNNKSQKKGRKSRRPKVKRDGALRENKVGLDIWGGRGGIDRLEGLLAHRESNLERAIQKGYPRAAVARYKLEVRLARKALERAEQKHFENVH